MFFIDHVDSYRVYSKEGTSNGKFADIFEEEYKNILEEFQPSFSDTSYVQYLSRFNADQVHQGYFSKDKKGNYIDSKLERGGTGSNDESAYNLIMKDKERLLSFDESVRFLFSHSALKEGWDNPNVFQICTLKDTSNEIKKRQEVGRGMRLCVNKNGERQDESVLGKNGVFDTNILTVIASESYDQFSKKLQTEMAQNIGTRPIKVTVHLFEDLQMVSSDGEEIKINKEKAIEIHEELICKGYIKKGKLTENYFKDKKEGNIDLGDELNSIKKGIIRRLDTVFDPDSILPDNARKPKIASFREDLFKQKFQNLWKKINVKTYYEVDFSTEALVKKAIAYIDQNLTVTEIRIVVEKGSLEEINDKESLENGSAMANAKARTIRISETVNDSVRYDLIGKLVESTGLTRKTIVAILKGIRPVTFGQFKMNPEEFIIKTSHIINDAKALAVIQQIEY